MLEKIPLAHTSLAGTYLKYNKNFSEVLTCYLLCNKSINNADTRESTNRVQNTNSIPKFPQTAGKNRSGNGQWYVLDTINSDKNQ